MGGFSAGFIVALPLAAQLAMRWQAGWAWRQTLVLMLSCHALLLALGGAGAGRAGTIRCPGSRASSYGLWVLRR